MGNKATKITVYFLAHSRYKYLDVIANELVLCQSTTKQRIQIVFLVDNEETKLQLSTVVKKLTDSGIVTESVIRSTYIEKCRYMSKAPTNLIMKHDEDIFMSHLVWDHFVSIVLQNNFRETPVVAPLISSGIPSVELFLDHWVSDKEARKLRKELVKVKFPNRFLGADYSHLNKQYNIESPYDFFKAANRIRHVYKGIHPIRLSSEVQQNLSDYCSKETKWKQPQKNKELIAIEESTYFCNSAFVCQKSFYKWVYIGMKLRLLFCDGFDEVAVNQFLRILGKKPKFAISCPAIHPSYNTIGPEYETISNKFFQLQA